MLLPKIVFTVILMLMSALFSIIPGLTRPDLFFAVTVAPDFRQTTGARRILRRFWMMVWTATLAGIAVELATGLTLVSLLILSAGFLGALVSSHGRALAYAAAPNPVLEVNLVAPREGLPGGPILAFLPVLSLAGLGLWVGLNWDRLPTRFPVHWGFQGPDRWVTSTPATVFGLLALQAFLCLLLAGSAWGVLNLSRRVSTSGSRAASERRFRRRVVQLMVVAGFFIACPAWFALFQPSAMLMNVWGAALAVVMLVFVVSLIHLGQGGSREAAAAPAAAEGDHTPDACWKWGVFYFNPADPAILTEKRFGIGYTLNFGNRWSWAVMFAVLLIPLALVGLLLR
jgi:uncharacterized membrane protein